MKTNAPRPNADVPPALVLLNAHQGRERVREIWERLASPDQSYFQSWGWIGTWLATLPEDAGLKLAVVRQGDAPVMAFFLGRRRIVRHGWLASRALYLNATGRPEYDELCAEYNRVACGAAPPRSLRELLALLPGEWDEFFLPALDAGAFPGNALALDDGRCRLAVERRVSSPYVDLDRVRDTANDYLSLLSANTRQQLRRAYREFGGKEQPAVETAGDAGAALDVFAEMTALHQQTWQVRGQEGAFAAPYMRRFHETLIRERFRHGEIQLLRVKSGSRTVGCLYNLLSNGRVYFYQSGVAYTDNPKLRPGLVCHVEAVKFNAAQGMLTYDFLGGEARYKASLATHRNEMVWARIQKPRLRFRVEAILRGMRRCLRGVGRGT